MSIGRVDHIAITVTDVEAATRFFAEVMGAQTVRDYVRDEKLVIRTILMGESVLNLQQQGGDLKVIAGVPTPGAADIAFRWLGPISEVVDLLAAKGIEIASGPIARHTSEGKPSHSVYFYGPDRHLLELMAED